MAYQGAHILYMKVSGNLGVPVFLPSAFLYSCAFPNRQQMFLTRQARSELARASTAAILVGWLGVRSSEDGERGRRRRRLFFHAAAAFKGIVCA